MRRILTLTIVMLFTAAAVMAQTPGVAVEGAAPAKPNQKVQDNPNAPEFKWEEELYDFGTIAKGSQAVAHKYWFTNVGKEPLIISKVDKTCGCTVPGWSKEPVMPGDRGWVEAKYVATSKVGSATKSIKVHSNAKTALKTLTFKVKVANEAAVPDAPIAPPSIFSTPK